jgi:protein dithiol:quinone oxidoreductase
LTSPVPATHRRGGAGHARSRLARDPFMPLAALLSFAAVGVALISQHRFEMYPCAWCTLQRLIYLCIGGLALVASAITLTTSARRSGRGTPRFNGSAALCALLSALGVVAALYQHFVAAKSESCAITLADKIIKIPQLDVLAPWLFKATAFCHEANIDLFRLPYAIWSALLFVVLLFLSLRGAWRSAR